jgi:hypothetical protein
MPQNCPLQSSFTQSIAQFTPGIPHFPQFTCWHHDGISRHSTELTKTDKFDRKPVLCQRTFISVFMQVFFTQLNCMGPLTFYQVCSIKSQKSVDLIYQWQKLEIMHIVASLKYCMASHPAKLILSSFKYLVTVCVAFHLCYNEKQY